MYDWRTELGQHCKTEMAGYGKCRYLTNLPGPSVPLAVTASTVLQSWYGHDSTSMSCYPLH